MSSGCTLCLSCVSACPTGALLDDPDRPALKFVEDACVQCGLCKATCPEKVITLKPQIDFRASRATARLIKEEEPALCIRCNKPFGVKSTIEKVAAKLEGRHWMYPGAQQARRRHQDVRRLPRHHHERAAVRSLRRRARARPAAHDRRLSARARARSKANYLRRGARQKIGQRLAIFRPSRCAAPASWCRAYRRSGRPRTVLRPSPASRRCSSSSARRRSDSRAATRSCGRTIPASVGPARRPSFSDKRVAGDAGAKHFGAMIAGIGRQADRPALRAAANRWGRRSAHSSAGSWHPRRRSAASRRRA